MKPSEELKNILACLENSDAKTIGLLIVLCHKLIHRIEDLDDELRKLKG